MRIVQITGSDDRMDSRDVLHEPTNPLPRTCDQCGFPDLDFVPQPYFLFKSRAMTPNEVALAEMGNFFVRERVRRILELLAPGQCAYYPTCYKGTSEQTPWALAVPVHQVVTARVNPAIARCGRCGEPRSAHPGTQWTESLFGSPPRNQPLGQGWTAESDYEILKSATWGSSESGWNKWITRRFFLSVRLLHLLKKVKAKGFHEATCQKPATPDKEESIWIKTKLQQLEAGGIPLHADGTLADDDAKWFREYLQSHARDFAAGWDIKAVERRVKTKLPKSYVDFVTTVGPTTFANIDDQEGFDVTILGPNGLGVEGLPKDFEEEESRAVSGLTFATTGHGDCFCFDVQKGKKEYQVFIFKHEYNLLEPYADNFAACVKRFAGGG